MLCEHLRTLEQAIVAVEIRETIRAAESLLVYLFATQRMLWLMSFWKFGSL